jgi:hypothetical protein
MRIVASNPTLCIRPNWMKDMGVCLGSSVTDRSNTESAFLEPSVDAAPFPGAFPELLGQCLSHDAWIASFTVLPTVEEMENSSEVHHELVAEVMEKAKHIVSFAITLAKKKTMFSNLVSRVLNTKSLKNLSSWFNDEDSSMDKVELSFENLEAPISQE